MTATMTADRTTALAEKLLATLNGGAVALLISLGHRTKLFDVMARMAPATPAEIAAEAGLSERYVREWLGGLTVAGVIDHDAQAGSYHLPAEHAALLTRAARPGNMAATMQWIGVLGAVEDEVAAAFRHGKGVPYSAYRRFHEVMAEESDQTTVAGLEDHIVPLVPGLKERLQAGIDVVDVGCGAGQALMKLAELFPRSRFVGYDVSPEGIGRAETAARSRGLATVRFAVRDVARWEQPEAFDLVTAFDAIHDQAAPAQVLRNIARALRPDGVFLMQDIKACSHHAGNRDLPLGPFIYAISCMHCMSVSLAGGGVGLGAAWGKELALRMLKEAGFGATTVHELPHDPLNLYYVSTPRPG